MAIGHLDVGSDIINDALQTVSKTFSFIKLFHTMGQCKLVLISIVLSLLDFQTLELNSVRAVTSVKFFFHHPSSAEWSSDSIVLCPPLVFVIRITFLH